MNADVVVLGAGVAGASIAYHLARLGARMVVVERGRAAGVAPGASWASAGGLRTQGRHSAEQPLARLAASRWPGLEAELGAPLEASFGGHLHLAETAAECDALRARVVSDAAGGIDVAWVEGAALRALAPGLAPMVVAGVYSAGDGQAHPGRAAAAFLAAAEREGAISCMTTSAEPAVAGGRVVGVRLSDDRLIAADQVVLATGAWGVATLRRLGLDLPLRWRGLTMLLSEVAPPLLSPTVTAVGRNLSLKQGPSGQMMVGGRWLVAAGDNVGAMPRPAAVGPQWRGAAAILPAMERLALAQSWAGAEAQTIDGLPLLGPVGPDGLYAALGFSGHGFQIAPAVGALVAAALTGTPQPLLAPFHPARFATTPAAEIRDFVAEPVAQP